MTVLYFINAVLLLFVIWGGITNLDKKVKLDKRYVCMILIVLVYFFAVGIAGFAGLKYVSALCCPAYFVSGAVLFGLSFAVKGKGSKAALYMYKVLAAVFLLEVFVFNFNAYKLSPGHYEPVDLRLSDAVINNYDRGTMGSDEASIEFTSVDREVGTIRIEAHSAENKKMNFYIDYADATNREYRTGIASAVIVNDCEKSFTVPINASGEVSRLKLRFRAEGNDVITVDDIKLNTPIAFCFSPVRMLAIIMLMLLKYIFCDSERFKRSFSRDERLCIRSARVTVAVFMLLAVVVVMLQRGSDASIARDFRQESGNQMTQELVDAFEAGRVSLLAEVNPELEALDNPYDSSQRSGLSYPWDHLYYNGKYYSYYGIAPVVLLFLPYHMLTGYYFPSVWAVFLFSIAGLYFLYGTYMLYMKEFFKDTKISLIIMGLIMTLTVSSVYLCLAYANFYEIAQSAGFMFCTGGFYFIARSGMIGKGRLRLRYAALSGVMLSLAVLSRPTNAVYCLCAMLFVYAGFLKLHGNAPSGGKTPYVKYLLASLLPYVVIGSVQMIYNYVRFGSPLSFGIEYSLTINDFINAQYHTHFVGIGFFNYLLALPSFRPNFPFMAFDVQIFNPNGYYFVATGTAAGMLWIAMPVISYLYSARAYAISHNSKKRLYALIIAAVCIAAPAAVIASVWESGYGLRYRVDFAWQLLIGALTVAFIMYNSLKSEETKNLLTKLFFISLAVGTGIVFAQTYLYVSPEFDGSLYKYICLFERSFEFWK